MPAMTREKLIFLLNERIFFPLPLFPTFRPISTFTCPDHLIDSQIPFIAAIIFSVPEVYALITIIALIISVKELVIDSETTCVSKLIDLSPASSTIHELVSLIATTISRVSEVYPLITIIALICAIGCLIFDLCLAIVEILIVMIRRAMAGAWPPGLLLLLYLDAFLPQGAVYLVCGSKRRCGCIAQKQEHKKRR